MPRMDPGPMHQAAGRYEMCPVLQELPKPPRVPSAPSFSHPRRPNPLTAHKILADAEVARLDTAVTWARALDGTEFMPGLVGLNNMKRNDYANVVIQTLVRIVPIRC